MNFLEALIQFILKHIIFILLVILAIASLLLAYGLGSPNQDELPQTVPTASE